VLGDGLFGWIKDVEGYLQAISGIFLAIFIVIDVLAISGLPFGSVRIPIAEPQLSAILWFFLLVLVSPFSEALRAANAFIRMNVNPEVNNLPDSDMVNQEEGSRALRRPERPDEVDRDSESSRSSEPEKEASIRD
jgi:hypothetical protein